MSHKKRHKPKQHSAHDAPASVSSSNETVAEEVAVIKKPYALFGMSVAVFFLGLFIGVVGGMFAFHVELRSVLASVTKHSEYLTEPDALEEGLVAEVSTSKTETIITETSSTTAFYYFVSGEASATSSLRSTRIPTLVYHSVRPHIKGESKYQDQYDVTPELLRKELTYLKEHGYTPVGYRDLLDYWQGATTSFPEKPIILSFDDGWRNQYQYAYPLLKEFHMKGVFFVFTNPIDNKKPHWMSWDELREMDAAGMEIGGHTRTHPMLSKITEDVKLDYEIKEPKEIIERELGHAIVAFAYPFGVRNEHVFSALGRAGYKFARTIQNGVWNDPEHSLTMHGTLSSDNVSDFIRLLEGR